MIPDINLLPKYEREGRTLFFVFGFIVLLLLLFIAYTGYSYITTKSELDEVSRHQATLNQQKNGFESQVEQLKKKDDVVTLKDAVGFVEQNAVPTSGFINELIDLLPSEEHNYLTNYTYSFGQVSIIVDFETMRETANFAANLKRSDYVNEINVGRVNTFDFNVYGKSEDDSYDFDSIPRYEMNASINVNKQKMLEGVDEDD